MHIINITYICSNTPYSYIIIIITSMNVFNNDEPNIMTIYIPCLPHPPVAADLRDPNESIQYALNTAAVQKFSISSRSTTIILCTYTVDRFHNIKKKKNILKKYAFNHYNTSIYIILYIYI